WSSFFVIAKARKNQIPTPFLTRESRHDSQKSSRNRKIFRLSVVSEVEVETPWGKVASVITTRAVRELGLEIGAEVIAFVKVTDMAIATLRDDSDLT
ncbi:MAG: TOBE domain-containing protein, partial [Methylocystis sp.]